MDFKNAIKEYYDKEIQVIKNLNHEEIDAAIQAVLTVYSNGGTIYTCGNGGSASTASHMQNDFNKGLNEKLEKKFNVLCLCDNVSSILAIGNDISYDEIFRFQLEGKMMKDDLLIAISGSGNSKNVLNAVDYAHSVSAKVIGITGYNGGRLKEISDYSMHVAENDMQIDEDIHMTFDHMMMRVIMNFLVNNIVSGKNIDDRHVV